MTTPVIFILEPFGGSVRRHNPALPFLFWDDAAVTRGDGVFETLLVTRGKAVNFERHAARFTRSAELLDLPAPDMSYWARATREAAAAWEAERGAPGSMPPDAKLVWTYTRGRASTGIPTAWLTLTEVPAETIAQRERGVRVLTVPAASRGTAPIPGGRAKTLDYSTTMSALRRARAAGADDVIWVDGERVLEGATSTVVIVKAGTKLRTPDHEGGDVLPGTTQAALFDAAERAGWRCKQKPLTVSDLREADSVWLLGSVRKGARVTSLDGVELPAPKRKAESRFRDLIDEALGA